MFCDLYENQAVTILEAPGGEGVGWGGGTVCVERGGNARKQPSEDLAVTHSQIQCWIDLL